MRTTIVLCLSVLFLTLAGACAGRQHRPSSGLRPEPRPPTPSAAPDLQVQSDPVDTPESATQESATPSQAAAEVPVATVDPVSVAPARPDRAAVPKARRMAASQRVRVRQSGDDAVRPHVSAPPSFRTRVAVRDMSAHSHATPSTPQRESGEPDVPIEASDPALLGVTRSDRAAPSEPHEPAIVFTEAPSPARTDPVFPRAAQPSPASPPRALYVPRSVPSDLFRNVILPLTVLGAVLGIFIAAFLTFVLPFKSTFADDVGDDVDTSFPASAHASNSTALLPGRVPKPPAPDVSADGSGPVTRTDVLDALSEEEPTGPGHKPSFADASASIIIAADYPSERLN